MNSPPLVAYHNGHLKPLEEVVVALNDAGFVFGATVTDLCRTFHRRPFRLRDHLARFLQSARRAHIPLAVPEGELQEIVEHVLAHNNNHAPSQAEWIIVLLATPGPLAHVFGQKESSTGPQPTLIVYAYPLPFWRYAPLVRQGAVLKTSSVRHISAESISPQIKQRSRLHWWIADHSVPSGSLALLLDNQGFVTETSTANFVIVRHGCVLTPRRYKVLHGVSLAVVEEICQRLGLPWIETDLRPEDCYGATEAWLCSTPYCLAPVAQIDDRNLACPGPLYERIITLWSADVGLDIRSQMLTNSDL
jgi:branched-subunit amino acid aminotransferase/4-amino-4-deoxychorismate lyase